MFFFESFYYFYSLKTKLFYNEMKHIRLIFSAILLSLVVPCGYAQTRQDSLAIAHAQWHTDTLQHGAVCMYTNIHVFDSPQQISIIKYDPKKYKTQIVQAPQMTMTAIWHLYGSTVSFVEKPPVPKPFAQTGLSPQIKTK